MCVVQALYIDNKVVVNIMETFNKPLAETTSLSARVPVKVYRDFAILAQKHGRSIAQQVIFVMKEAIKKDAKNG